MADYRFLTTWVLEAPLQPIWDALYDVERWPSWWRGVERVTELVHGEGNGVGTVYRHVWRSVIPYEVTFDARVTRVEEPHVIEAAATGSLEGTGTFRLFAAPVGTAVTYEWAVRTTKSWMNVVAPVGRPVFAWNHHAVMKNGGRGLAQLLGARLLAHGSS
jgi:uncharacterized protein YndB with AHSA1/START domain